MNQHQLFEAVRTFFKQTTRLNDRGARLSLEWADAAYRRASISLQYGLRKFRVEIDRSHNLICLSEITVRRHFEFDNRNPLNSFTLRETECKRTLHTHRLDRYWPEENDLDKGV